MCPKRLPTVLAVFGALALTLVVAQAQGQGPGVQARPFNPNSIPKPDPNAQQRLGDLYFTTMIGSFKINPVGDIPAQGTLTMSFQGTVLVSGDVKQAIVTPGAGVILELDRSKQGKRVYHGNGTITISGRYKGIQFFGEKLNAYWHGYGILLLYGEFDKNLNTGSFWYKGDPSKSDWGSGGHTVTVPKSETSNPMPRVKILSGKG